MNMMNADETLIQKANQSKKSVPNILNEGKQEKDSMRK